MFCSSTQFIATHFQSKDVEIQMTNDSAKNLL